MAGVLGFEPRNGGVKVRCLTAWRYPNRGDRKQEVKERQSRGFAYPSERIIVKNAKSQNFLMEDTHGYKEIFL
jgi:hypothetical protein